MEIYLPSASKNPWKTLNSRKVYENDWITVREDNVIRPDGHKGIYSVVETRLATGVIAMTPSQEIYLVGQYRYPLDFYSWEIIEGGSDPGETPLAAAQRELREEAGLTAAKWELLGDEIHLSNCHSSECAYLYLASELTEVKANPEGVEDLQIHCLPFSEALALVDDGYIKDAMSIMAILRLARYLKQ